MATRTPEQGKSELFNKFSKGAREALDFAQDEAKRLEQNGISPEHLLLGLLKMPDIRNVLDGFGIEPEKMKPTLEFCTTVDPEISKNPPTEKPTLLTDRTRKVITIAVNEFIQTGAREITPIHILIGLIEEGGFAAGVLVSTRPFIDQLRRMPPPEKSSLSV